MTVGFGFVGRTKPPTSGWITAMDIYILFCFIMVFLAFVEFAFISFIGIFVARLKMTDLVRVMTLRQMTRCLNLVLEPNLAPNLHLALKLLSRLQF